MQKEKLTAIITVLEELVLEIGNNQRGRSSWFRSAHRIVKAIEEEIIDEIMTQQEKDHIRDCCHVIFTGDTGEKS